MTLAPGRVHELCGPSRITLALAVARRLHGPVLWITPGWMWNRPNPDGIAALVDPARLVFVSPATTEAVLWCAEESLRTGAAPLVVIDLPAPPALTPVRRLHLAAQTGVMESRAPLGLILTAEGAAPGIETRWALSPRHHEADWHEEAAVRGPVGAWRLDLLRARMIPPASWPLSAARRGAGALC